MARRREPGEDLDLTTKFWWTTEDLAQRWHVSEKRVRELLAPHRRHCHLARRGRHPRLCLWIPIEIVKVLDRDRNSTTRVGLRLRSE